MMNDSNLPNQINRNIYKSQKQSKNILQSRTITLANNIKTLIKSPLRFSKKLGKILINNPKRLAEFATGRRMVNSVSEAVLYDESQYQQWIKENSLSKGELAWQRRDAKNLSYRPLVSLITPVFNPPYDAHNKLIQSVVNQTYDNFELLLYNFSNDDNKDVEKLLNDWAARDKRIIVKQGLKNQHISKNSNRCLQDVEGEFIGLLDHDDALTPDCLYECVKVLNDDKTFDFIYTDKDKISVDDVRFDAQFKPEWSPEMALGGNYLTHFNLMRTKIVREVGGWDSKTDGAQDWDIFFKVIGKNGRVKHIPKITYHWRTVPSSTAGSMATKPYALVAQNLAVKHQLDSLGVSAEPYHDEFGQPYVRWPRTNAKDILIIVHSYYGDYENIKKIIELISTNEIASKCRLRLIIDEGGVGKFDKNLRGNLVEYKIGQFTQSVKSIVKKEKPKAVIYLKDSVSSIKSLSGNDWVSQLVGWIDMPGVGIASGAVYAENGQVIDVGSIYNARSRHFERLFYASGHRPGFLGYIQWLRNLILVGEQIFAFDPKLIKDVLLGARDDEFSIAIALTNYKNGKRAVYDPTVCVKDESNHYLRLDNSDSIEKLLNSCPELGNGDPYYNKNLLSNFDLPMPITKSSKCVEPVYIKTLF